MIAEEDIGQVEHANDKRKHAQHDGTYVQLQVLHNNSLSFFISINSKAGAATFISNYLDDLAHHLDTIQLHMVEKNQVHEIAVMG